MRAKMASSLDGKLLLDADRAERHRDDSKPARAATSDSRPANPPTTQLGSVTAALRAPMEVIAYDGLSPLHLELDDEGSLLWYLPPARAAAAAAGNDAVVGTHDAGGAVAAAAVTWEPEPDQWFHELARVLCEADKQLPVPPKDTSASNGRAQYYGKGRGLRANPRWCNAARALEGVQLECVLRVQAAVESAILALLPSAATDVRGTGCEPGMTVFNSVLVNRYQDGTSHVAWHADDEKCYGSSDSILIGSVSLGAARSFEVRRKPRKGDTDSR